MDIPLDEVVFFDVITSTTTTGAAVDADSAPTFAVYEESTDTDIGIGGSMTKRTSRTGNYRGSFTVSSANGFEVGKWYSVVVTATVATVVGKCVARSFRVVAAEAITGKCKVDVDALLGTAWLTPAVAGTPDVNTKTNGDKTGYALSGAGVQAVWDALTSALTAAGSIGKWLVDKLPVAVSTPPSAASIASQVRTELAVELARIDAQISLTATSIDMTTLLGRLTNARAGYLDYLNTGSVVATQADINALNQSASRRIIITTVPQYERPESSSTSYTIEARTYDGDGAAVAADSTPTLTATGILSGSLAANLSAASVAATGVYRWTYSVASGATAEQVRFDISAVISSATFTLSAYAQVVDLVSATWTSADSTRLTAVYNKLPTKAYFAGTANSDGDVQLDEATGTPADSSGTGTLLARILGTLAAGTHNAQSGDTFARIGLAGVGLTNLGDTRLANIGSDTSGTSTLLTRILGTLAAGTHSAQSGDAFARLGLNGVGLTNLGDARLANIATSAQIKTALEADGSKLDHLWEMTEDNGGLRRLTALALALAPSGGGGGGGGDATLAKQTEILDAITALEADGSKLDHLWEMTEDNGGLRRLTALALALAPTYDDAALVAMLEAIQGVSFNTNTDSLKALSTAVSGLAASTGAGAFTLTITVDDGTDPLENATVRLTEGITTLTAKTDANGEVAFAVDAATWSVAITKAGYTFTPTTKLVSASAGQTYSMDVVSIALPDDPAKSTVLLICYDEACNLLKNARINVRQVTVVDESIGFAFDGSTKTYRSDEDGQVTLTLWKSATYRISRGSSSRYVEITPTNDIETLDSILGVD